MARSMFSVSYKLLFPNQLQNLKLNAYINCVNSVSVLPDSGILYRRYATKVPKKEKGKKGKPKVQMSEDEMNQVIDVKSYNENLCKAVDKLKADYIKHLAIRSTPAALEVLPVKLENQEIPLNQIAQLFKKNPQLFVINAATAPQAVKPIMQAISESGMDLNAQLDGSTIFITIPKVTKEYRENLARNAKTMYVNTKDAIQEIQNRFLRAAKKQKEAGVSEDLVFNTQANIVTIANGHIAQAEKLMTQKQSELLGSN
uniref:Ribosome-recycling factor, mitochondrial n=1 Tax=Strigamia maritima TaxID=126957 RepID=T1JHB5_STRMM